MDVMNDTTTISPTDNDQCTLTEEEILNSYNLTLHIISVFVLLTVSFLGATLSVASVRIKRLHISPIIINTGKFFGSGVILATGFVHILPDAMEALTDPCLPDSWNVYGAYAGLFAMLAVLIMQLIEFLAHQRYRSMQHKHTHVTANVNVKECNHEHPNGHIEVTINNEAVKNNNNIEQPIDADQIVAKQIDNNEISADENSSTVHRQTSVCDDKNHKDVVSIEIIQVDPPTPESVDPYSAAGHFHGAAFQDDDQNHKITTYLLELGIALHSVLIGLTLGTTTDSFVALFIALCFHQFFEAIALGAQIAHLKTKSIKPAIYMIVFFSLTTPVGIAIGIGIHAGTYNPKSVSSLLVTGILDSLSAGVLIYVALVNLISAEMGPNAHAFFSLSKRLKVLYFVALYLGVAAMAVIGRWA